MSQIRTKRAALACAICAMAVFDNPGKCCADAPEDPRIAKTKEALRVALGGGGAFAKDDDAQYMKKVKLRDQKLTGDERNFSLGFQRGYEAVANAKASDFAHPMILCAKVFEREGHPEQIELFMFFLASEENTKGVFIQDAVGKILATGKVEVGFGSEDLLQCATVRLTPGGNPKLPEILLDRKALTQDLSVGLIEKDGHRTKPVQAFIEQDLRKGPKGKAKE